LYSDLDVERLRLLHRLTKAGHPISRLARARLEELTALAQERAAGDLLKPSVAAPDAAAAAVLSAALAAVRALRAGELQSLLERGAVTLGFETFLDRVTAPLLQEVGTGWREGSISVGQEHLCTAACRRVVGWLLGIYQPAGDAPRIVVATPARQVHELGALLVAASAAAEGWSVTYLGSDVPAADLIAAARDTGAGVVALSAVYPADDATLLPALARVGAGLPGSVRLLVGGAAAQELRGPIEGAGATVVDSLSALRSLLRGLRAGGEAA
jgi:methanogenic corrinoid protein MtbC1